MESWIADSKQQVAASSWGAIAPVQAAETVEACRWDVVPVALAEACSLGARPEAEENSSGARRAGAEECFAALDLAAAAFETAEMTALYGRQVRSSHCCRVDLPERV